MQVPQAVAEPGVGMGVGVAAAVVVGDRGPQHVRRPQIPAPAEMGARLHRRLPLYRYSFNIEKLLSGFPAVPLMNSLPGLLEAWTLQLATWARHGAIGRAAVEAFQLGREPEVLRTLVAGWAAGSFETLPAVVLLPAGAMPLALGAYAASTGTIYLNQEWLQSASPNQALAVLTEELGHHLDALLNASDTPGDEGALFAALLTGAGPLSQDQRQAFTSDDDRGTVWVNEQAVAVERAATVTSIPIPPSLPGRTSGEVGHGSAFAAVRSDGSVVTWGAPDFGGNSSGIDFDGPQGTLKVTQIFSNTWAFAALRNDGSVISWGDTDAGGDSSAVDFDGPNGTLKVVRIFSADEAFAALRSNGSVVSWGNPLHGGNSSGVDFDGPSGTLTVSQIVSTGRAFAALRSDGSVVSWGDPTQGGDSNGVDFDGPSGTLKVVQLFSAGHAFAALRNDGSVVTWGDPDYGGNSSGVDFDGPNNNLQVSQIFSAIHAFAALRSNGSVVSWGYPFLGGNSSSVDFDGPTNTLTVSQIYSNDHSFAAVRSNGSVVTWGDSFMGGNSNGVDFDGPTNTLKVSKIFASSHAFAALRNDGSVVSWGFSSAGGNSSGVDFDGPSNSLQVVQIVGTNWAFAALRNDGSVVSWGGADYGGNSSGVDFDGPGNTLKVTQIFSTATAFAALRSDGSVVSWGGGAAGDSSGVDFDGPTNTLKVVAFANPFTDDRVQYDEPVPVSTYSIARLALPSLASDGNEGSRHHFRITRSGNIASPGAVRFSTISGTATSGQDFLPVAADIPFQAGETTKDVFVDSLKDLLNEGTERFNATITRINTQDTIAAASAFADILDLPPPSTYSIERLNSDGDEGHRHTFLIKRVGGLSAPGQVRFSTASDSATSGDDFQDLSVIRNFAAHQDRDIVSVDSLKDDFSEGTERFQASLSKIRAQDTISAPSTFGQIFNRSGTSDEHPVTSIVGKGDTNIDGLLSADRWATPSGSDVTVVSFGFSTSIDDYELNYQNRNAYKQSFKSFNQQQKTTTRRWLNQSFAGVANVGFTEKSLSRDATIRLALSNFGPYPNSPKNVSHAFDPSGSYAAGDVWLNTDDFHTPVIGSWASFELGRQLGRAMGLKTPQETHLRDAKVNPDRDSVEFTIMSRRSTVGGDMAYRNEKDGFPQSLMMNDIAALQHLYGAHFMDEDSRYTFSPLSGEIFINGQSQGKPAANRIFRTIWDGGGLDTYDFSRYNRNLIIDLKPGGWSDLHAGGNLQRANLQTGVAPKYAAGHIYNALEYNGDPRSLIENAIGGSANDRIQGNRVNNHLDGKSGNDTIIGGAGNDDLFGDAGNDFLSGETDSDHIQGGLGNDTIYGGPGDDELYGNGGHDLLHGGIGKDRLMGVAPNATGTPGLGSIDTLTGAADDDVFYLGNSQAFFYTDGSPATAGRGDYARITDFTSGDLIQLKGQASDYLLRKDDSVGPLGSKGFGLYRNDGVGPGATAGLDGRDEFIALIQVQPGLNLSLTNSAQFVFI